MSSSIKATYVHFDPDSMWVELSDGRTLGVPLTWFLRLLRSTAEQREQVRQRTRIALGSVGRRYLYCRPSGWTGRSDTPPFTRCRISDQRKIGIRRMGSAISSSSAFARYCGYGLLLQTQELRDYATNLCLTAFHAELLREQDGSGDNRKKSNKPSSHNGHIQFISPQRDVDVTRHE